MCVFFLGLVYGGGYGGFARDLELVCSAEQGVSLLEEDLLGVGGFCEMASFEQFEREIMDGGGVEGPQEFDEVEEGEVRQKSGRKYALLTRNSSSIRITHAISAGGEGGDRNGGRWKNLNKYALACALLASLNSTLLGYGEFTSFSWI